ncbi:GNAT family N-acetyltransferase [Sulfurimonas sp.]|uniref:GNAT family N-acetyltransferase n=1 Tax=Sulfurimonas sp. TaxID=2022749 RepID=UPI002AAFE973|nr:GNAT family N-acetyltransferase [Sulfurimonas sp.]
MSDNVIIERFDFAKTYNGLRQFDCNHDLINRFVKKSMKKQVENDYSAAYILLDLNNQERFIGFYTITTFSIQKSTFEIPLKSSPSSVPVFRIIMLGVDKKYANRGYGSKLLKHCFKLVLRASEEVGAKGLYLDAEDKKHEWYKKLGFEAINSPDKDTNIMPMFISTDTIRDALC